MTLHVNDAATWRQLKQLWVNDAGTWRGLKYLWVNDAGTWRKIYSYIHSFSGTAGQFEDGLGNIFTGYESPVFGTLSPATLPDGKTINLLDDWVNISQGRLRIAGFSSDPGVSYFTSVTVNSTTKTTATASSYVYSAGAAAWTWSTAFGFANTIPYTGSLTY